MKVLEGGKTDEVTSDTETSEFKLRGQKAEGEPVVDLPATAQSRIPAGMIEGLKNIRYEIAQIHGHFTKEHGMIPSFLSGAYTAIEDAETFLKNVANGKEEFTPVPAKPLLNAADIQVTDGMVKIPSNLKDVAYMQEWAATFFFPTLRKLVGRTDIEVDIRGEMNKKKKLQLAIRVTTAEKTEVLDTKFKANDIVNIEELAKVIAAI